MVRAAREWVSFDDPDEEGVAGRSTSPSCSRTGNASSANGCQGVLEEKAPELILGCCTYGAHFTDKKDRDAVVKMARALGDDEWQFAKIGRKKGIYAKVGKNDDGSPDWRTRLVKDACIFLNRRGFGAGPGCALHQHSMRIGEHHSDWKPEVCWQLPLRCVDDEQEDGSVISTRHRVRTRGLGRRRRGLRVVVHRSPRSVHRSRARVPHARRRAAEDAREEDPPLRGGLPRRAARGTRLRAGRPSRRGTREDHQEEAASEA